MNAKESRIILALGKNGPLRSDELSTAACFGGPAGASSAALALRDRNPALVYSQNDGERYNLWGLTPAGTAEFLRQTTPQQAPPMCELERTAAELAAQYAKADGVPYTPLEAVRLALRLQTEPEQGKFIVLRRKVEEPQGKVHGTYEAALAHANCKAATRGAEGFVYEVVDIRAALQYVPPIAASTKVEEF